MRFGVLALGDSTYEKFCEAGKRLDRRFGELGAARLLPRVDCDVDYDDPAGAWIAAALALLAQDRGELPARAAASAAKVKPAAFDKRNPFPATIIDNIALTGRGSSKETRHIEISLIGSGLTFEPGDALGVAPRNDPALVATILASLGFDGAGAAGAERERDAFGASPGGTLRDYGVDAAFPRALGRSHRRRGAEKPDRRRERGGPRRLFPRPSYRRVLRAFPAPGLTPETFVSGLRPLQPRLYSIASSLAANPGEAHLTISTVRYQLHGEARAGVASGFFADRCPPDLRGPRLYPVQSAFPPAGR